MASSLQDVFVSSASHDEHVHAVLRGYGPPWNTANVRILPIARGLSGAGVWKITSNSLAAALHIWPIGYPDDRLRAIHGILAGYGGAGIGFIPHPVDDARGETVQFKEGRLWDLVTWRPGESAVAAEYCEERIRSALAALRKLHDLGSELTRGKELAPIADRVTAEALRLGRPMKSPGLVRRQKEWFRLSRLLNDGSLPEDPCHLVARTFEAAARAQQWWNSGCLKAEERFPLTICWNDPRRENLLFIGDEISGLIDYGSLGIDFPAADLGRLLGSFLPNHPERWPTLLGSYDDAASAKRWARWAWHYFRAGTLIAALHWWEWHLLQKRPFANPQAAYDRWRYIVETLEQSPGDANPYFS